MQAWRIAGVIVSAAALLASCIGPGSEPAFIRFDAAKYYGGPAREYEIEPNDLTAAGSAQEVAAGVEGETVFALDGVDPAQALAMPAREEGPYWIFLSENAVESGRPVNDTIPGLCSYLREPPEEGCPQ